MEKVYEYTQRYYSFQRNQFEDTEGESLTDGQAKIVLKESLIPIGR